MIHTGENQMKRIKNITFLNLVLDFRPCGYFSSTNQGDDEEDENEDVSGLEIFI